MFLAALGVGVAIVVVVVLATAGGDDGGDEAAAARPGATQDATLRVGLGEAPQNLNPIFGDQYGTIYGDKWQFFNGLVGRGKNLELVPELAAELPTVSDDGRTVTVKLREGVKFHDGSELTADDVVFTYQSILDPAVATGLDDELFERPKLTSVAAVDRSTVRFTLAAVDPDFVGKLDIGIVPAAALRGKDLNKAAFNTHPVGTGAYRFVELRADRMVMEANPDYFEGPVGIKRVIFSFVPDTNARAAQIAAGKVDVEAASLPPELAKRCCSGGATHTVAVPGDTYIIQLPTQNALFKDVKVRQAIASAVDRAALVDGVLDGAGDVQYTPFSPGTEFHDGSLQVELDRDRSKSLLAQAGYSDSDGDGIVERAGRPLRFKFAYYADPIFKALSLAVRSDLRKIGVDASLQGLGFDGTQDHLRKGGALLSQQVFAYGPGRDGIQRAFGRHGLTDDDVSTNPTRLRDEAVFNALEDGESTLDLAARKAAYKRFQEAIIADSSWIYLMRQDHVFTVADDVDGVDPQAFEGHLHSYGRALLWNLSRWTTRASAA